MQDVFARREDFSWRVLTSSFHRLVKVHSSGTVFIELLDDTVEFLTGEGGEEFTDETTEGFGGDVSLTFLVVDSEGVLEFSLHGFNVGILDQELSAELTKLSELNLSGTVLIDLFEDFLEFLLAGPETHRPQDLVQVISRQKLHLLGVEPIEAGLEALDLVVLEPGGLVDLLELDAGVRISLGHDD